MVFANLFYWCTNQYVIQRTLAARSLAEGQKGVLAVRLFQGAGAATDDDPGSRGLSPLRTRAAID